MGSPPNKNLFNRLDVWLKSLSETALLIEVCNGPETRQRESKTRADVDHRDGAS